MVLVSESISKKARRGLRLVFRSAKVSVNLLDLQVEERDRERRRDQKYRSYTSADMCVERSASPEMGDLYNVHPRLN